MNLLWLNISIGLLVTLVLIIRNYSRKISAYFFSLLWEAILIKLLLSFLIPVCKNIINKCFVEAVDTASENLNWGIFENLNLKYIYIWMDGNRICFDITIFFELLVTVKTNSQI